MSSQLHYQVELLESEIEGMILGISMAGPNPNNGQAIIDATREIIKLVSAHERKQNIKKVLEDRTDIKDVGGITREYRTYDERDHESVRTHFATILKKAT
jgi:hypothetical protein